RRSHEPHSLHHQTPLRVVDGQRARILPTPSRGQRPFVVGVTFGVSQIGWTKAPLPAESQTANRTHALPAASNGIAKCFVPNGAESLAEITWRSTFLPSPHTTSTKFSGNVQSTSAAIVRALPAPATL